MSELYNELENKINSTNTVKLTDVEEDLVQAKNDEDITEEEFDRLVNIVKHRVVGLNL